LHTNTLTNREKGRERKRECEREPGTRQGRQQKAYKQQITIAHTGKVHFSYCTCVHLQHFCFPVSLLHYKYNARFRSHTHTHTHAYRVSAKSFCCENNKSKRNVFKTGRCQLCALSRAPPLLYLTLSF